MQITTIDRINLSHELQQRLADYEVGRDIYIKLQNQYTEVVREDVRLKQKATELEGQARRTDTSWNAMAKSGTIDQGKINEEIERSAQLRKDAQALHLTAEARIGIQKDLAVQLAEARLKLIGAPSAINKEYQETLLTKALKQGGTLDILLELFVLSRDVLLTNVDAHSLELSRCHSQHERQEKIKEFTWMAFGKKLETLFDGADVDISSPTLATLPSPVQKETVVDSFAALQKLKRTIAAP